MINWTKTHKRAEINKILIQRAVGNDPKRFGYSKTFLVWWRFVPKAGYKEPEFEPRMAVMNFVNNTIAINGVIGEVEISHFSSINKPS